MAEAILRAEGLGHRFADGNWAFRGIDFELGGGQISLLAGRNGAGKTMFAKHLAGLLEPSEGSVRFRGQSLGELKGSVASRVGYVFQDARLQAVGEKVFEDALFGPTNLGLPKAEARTRAEEALASCGLSDKAELFVHSLSGGELRRLAIAGVLAMRPEVLILDEPFANLDPSGVTEILSLIKGIAAEGVALLLVTHEIEKVLALATSFAIMDSGKIALQGDAAEVLSRGIESYGLRDPFRPSARVEDLLWL
jgi:biotin transport system ATP-binding protein